MANEVDAADDVDGDHDDEGAHDRIPMLPLPLLAVSLLMLVVAATAAVAFVVAFVAVVAVAAITVATGRGRCCGLLVFLVFAIATSTVAMRQASIPSPWMSKQLVTPSCELMIQS